MSFDPNIFETFDKGWALLTAGTPDHFNTMTVSWGGLGTLWSVPVATVYVRTSRYTHDFMDDNELFTLSFFPEKYKKDLGILGSKSGRDCDKVALTSLTPKAIGAAVTFEEAEQTILCKKIYRQDMDPALLMDSVRDTFYHGDAIHTIYIGQVLETEE